jgi:hypothetical protein
VRGLRRGRRQVHAESGKAVNVIEYPATTCECSPPHRQHNGYGTCLRCGGAYVAEFVATEPFAPIVIPQADEKGPPS